MSMVKLIVSLTFFNTVLTEYNSNETISIFCSRHFYVVKLLVEDLFYMTNSVAPEK